MQSRRLDIGEGAAWYGCGWRLFRPYAAMWILLGILFLVLGFLCSMVPVGGQIAFTVALPLLAAGFYTGADRVREGGSLQIGVLFTAFTDNEIRGPLLVLGGVFLALTIAATVVMILLVGPGVVSPGAEGTTEGPRQLIMHNAGVGFVALLFMSVLIAMCMFFAVPLTTFDGVGPLEAVGGSFQAAMKNILPFLVFFIIYIVLLFIASIPFFLGLLLLVPIVFCSVYCAYRGVFK